MWLTSLKSWRTFLKEQVPIIIEILNVFLLNRLILTQVNIINFFKHEWKFQVTVGSYGKNQLVSVNYLPLSD